MTHSALGSDHSILVDVHHHMVPPDYLKAWTEEGLEPSGFPAWDPQRSLRIMDRLGIGRALLSLPPPGVWRGDEGKARRLARVCNEYGARLAAECPDRFGTLAALPFPHLDGALEELTYALDSLRLDGVILFSNVQGSYVGDPEFDPLMAELNDHKALVLLHPNSVHRDQENAALYPWAEYPIDVARAWTRMIFNDTLVRYPEIRWVLGHAGGVVPFMADRLGKAHYAKVGGLRWGRILKDLIRRRHGGLELAKNVSYDTVGATNPATFAGLRCLAEPQKILFGSNFPWNPEESVEASVHFLSRRTLNTTRTQLVEE